MIYKLISHINPIDQKHSFGSFPLQAPYLTDMNNTDLAASNGAEAEEGDRGEVRGKILCCQVRPQLSGSRDEYDIDFKSMEMRAHNMSTSVNKPTL